tara:strand:- start:2097 stop:2480 length:384 start_codon:yes stop_codon:yes gene_type:complete
MDKTRRKFLQAGSLGLLGMAGMVNAAHHEGLFVHIFLLKFKPEVPEEKAADLMKQLAELKGKIPELKEFLIGKDVSGRNKGYHYAQVSFFDSPEDLEVYEKHPLHRALVKEIGPRLVEGLAMDYYPL